MTKVYLPVGVHEVFVHEFDALCSLLRIEEVSDLVVEGLFESNWT